MILIPFIALAFGWAFKLAYEDIKLEQLEQPRWSIGMIIFLLPITLVILINLTYKFLP